MHLGTETRKKLQALISRYSVTEVARAAELAPSTVRTAVGGLGCHPETVERLEALLADLDREARA